MKLILFGDTVIALLCRAVGYDPALVTRIKIVAQAGGPVVVEVDGCADAGAFDALEGTLANALKANEE